jgi:hypothetical protein
MQIDLPDVLNEVHEAFARYEEALVTGDTTTLDLLFHSDERTIRYGIGENLYGMEAIRAFRRSRPAVRLSHTLSKTSITTYGRDFATASTLFYPSGAPDKVGRQMQTWVRFADGWRIVAAHVSLISAVARDDSPQTY